MVLLQLLLAPDHCEKLTNIDPQIPPAICETNYQYVIDYTMISKILKVLKSKEIGFKNDFIRLNIKVLKIKILTNQILLRISLQELQKNSVLKSTHSIWYYH